MPDSRNTAALYARYSPRPKHKDIERAETLEAQLERMQAYCQLRGLEAAYRFADPLVSGRKPLAERDDGAKLLRLLKVGKVKHVVVSKLDRIFRNQIDGTQTERLWRRKGIALHLADQGGVTLDTSTATGWLIFNQLLLLAEFEPRQTSERTQQASRRYQANGKRMGSIAPYGWMIDPASPLNKISGLPSGLVEKPEEQAVLEQIRHWRFAEGLSARAITARLNELEIPSRRGGRWIHSTVERICSRLRAAVPA
jgi:putative DNA-invertase from lambdoid prophage Rac